MRILFVILITIIVMLPVLGETDITTTSAITVADNREVLLNEDGTWAYSGRWTQYQVRYLWEPLAMLAGFALILVVSHKMK